LLSLEDEKEEEEEKDEEDEEKQEDKVLFLTRRPTFYESYF